MRRLYQNHMSDSEGAQSIDKGGTGATTLPQGAKNLGLVTRDMANRPNGVLLLNSLGALDKNALPGSVSDPSNPSLYGDDVVTVNQTLTLKITNYDSFVNYTVSAVGGTAVVKGEDVIFTAGSTAAAGSITLNGKSYGITVVSAPEAIVATPSITSPVNGATSMAVSVTVTSSAFSITNSTDTHASSDWEVATDADFATVTFSSYNDLLNLTSWTITALQNLTKYYVRTRQRSSGGKVSDWSAVSNFTTKDTLPTVEQAKLLAGDPATSDYFGASVSLSANGNTALVSAYRKDGPAGSNQGAVYVLIRTGSAWAQQAKLLANDPASYDRFGAEISLSSDGNTALVGALMKNGPAGNYQGAAYVFTRSGSVWTQQAKLLANDPSASDQFGVGLSLSPDGSTALIGAYVKNGPTNISQQGAAYVFTRSGSVWTQQAKLLASDPAESDFFSYSVALSSDGNTALIGAWHKVGVAGTQQGAAYVFTRSGSVWTQQAKLLAGDPAQNDAFGWSVSLSSDGNTALIGAYSKYTSYTGEGAAYVFTRSGAVWSQQAKLVSSDPSSAEYFGGSVSLSSDGATALIGAYNKTGTAGAGQGAAYVFTRSGSVWTQQTKLLASDPATDDYFGYSVSLSSDGATALIGAQGKIGTYPGQGAAYIKI